jgi:PhnB protein
MRFDVYVNYPGCCEEAFAFYAQHLGATLESLVRHGEQSRPGLPPEWGDKVLHARLAIGGTTLMGADVPAAEPMRSAYLTLSLDSVEEAERVYGMLSEGGAVFMAMMETGFARRFAMLRDRFGASWMILYQD